MNIGSKFQTKHLKVGLKMHGTKNTIGNKNYGFRQPIGNAVNGDSHNEIINYSNSQEVHKEPMMGVNFHKKNNSSYLEKKHKK